MEVDAKDGFNRRMVLHLAARGRKEAIVRLLLEAKAKDNDRWTVLHKKALQARL